MAIEYLVGIALDFIISFIFGGLIYWSWKKLEKIQSIFITIRKQTESRERPFRILLVSDGESEAANNPEINKLMPDSQMRLTKRGKHMAYITGQEIERYLCNLYPSTEPPPRVVMWVSPFYRARQTALSLLSGMSMTRKWVSQVRESPLLVEQDKGLFESLGEEEMKRIYPNECERLEQMNKHQGNYWVRFPLGESQFDVCQRMQILFGSIVRDRLGDKQSGPAEVIIVVAHPVPIASFVMMWCHRTIEWFRTSLNIPYCSVRLIDSSNELWDAGFIFGGWQKENLFEPEHLCSPTNCSVLNLPNEIDSFGRMRMSSWVTRTQHILSYSESENENENENLTPKIQKKKRIVTFRRSGSGFEFTEGPRFDDEETEIHNNNNNNNIPPPQIQKSNSQNQNQTSISQIPQKIKAGINLRLNELKPLHQLEEESNDDDMRRLSSPTIELVEWSEDSVRKYLRLSPDDQ